MNAASLQQQIDSLQQLVGSLQQALEDARRENTLLRQKLDALARRYFGKQSEALDSAQLQLLLNGLAQESVELPPRQSLLPLPRSPRRVRTGAQSIRTPDNLEVVREVIEPEIVQAEPDQWKCISQETALVVNVPTEPYRYAEPDEYRLAPHDTLPYDWARKDG